MRRMSEKRLEQIAGDEYGYSTATHDEFRAMAAELLELRKEHAKLLELVTDIEDADHD